jgi:hypothetical protein
MKNLLRLEESAQFLICLWALALFDVPWWSYVLLAVGPDVGMLGYLAGPRVGALSYNVLHHKGLALLVLACGWAIANTLYLPMPAVLDQQVWIPAGLILFGHASMDRMFGFGLKFGDNFHHTHLGWIGGKSGQ